MPRQALKPFILCRVSFRLYVYYLKIRLKWVLDCPARLEDYIYIGPEGLGFPAWVRFREKIQHLSLKQYNIKSGFTIITLIDPQEANCAQKK